MTFLQHYLGSKLVQAEPADKGDVPGYFVFYEDGYASWSPKDVFDKAYRPTDGLSFGLAMEAMKKGMKVFRNEWGFPKVRHLEFVPETEYKLSSIKDVREGYFVYWLPCHRDLFADDWVICTEQGS